MKEIKRYLTLTGWFESDATKLISSATNSCDEYILSFEAINHRAQHVNMKVMNVTYEDIRVFVLRGADC